MKYLFASDIHGSIDKFEKVLEAFEREGADKLVLLGDTSSSDSNSDNWLIADALNKIKSKVEIIRGNCDRYEFEELLEFEIYDIDNLYINGKFVTITHGHYYNMYELPINCGEIFIQGHTHVPVLEKRGEKIVANPGSVSRPRGVDLRCYLVIDEENVSLKTLEGKIVKTLAL
jgi:putative phosphoesterase